MLRWSDERETVDLDKFRFAALGCVESEVTSFPVKEEECIPSVTSSESGKLL